MIYISIGTTGNGTAGVGICSYIEHSENEFKTWEEALQFVSVFRSKMDKNDWRTIAEVIQAAGRGEEVDPEMEIRDSEGQYTNFNISIRGHQDPNWELLRDELERAWTYMGQCGSIQGKHDDGRRYFESSFNQAGACVNAILHHADVNEALRVAS